MTLWIDNQARQGQGEDFISTDPFTNEVLWHGKAASAAQIDDAVKAARLAFNIWKNTPFESRKAIVLRFGEKIQEQAQNLAVTIAKETGKPLWEAKTEVAAMHGKIAISIRAYKERTGIKRNKLGSNQLVLRHHPLGVMSVFGPYNFPAHLPNGHIVPALLAGNSLVFKPSELTPLVAEKMLKLWLDAGLPKGVLNLVQGTRETGRLLSENEGIDGVLFTGSAKTGKLIHQVFAGKPDKLLALEMGGNNPLIVSKYFGQLDSTLYALIQSAFISAGQRCTCARRLFVPHSQANLILTKLVEVTKKLKIGGQFDSPTPFMGSLISKEAASNMMKAEESLVALGGKSLLKGDILKNAMVSPAIIDLTEITGIPDEEVFAPLLQVIRYNDLDKAVEMANNTKFGLSAGLISTDNQEWEYFLSNIRAGIVNRNCALTGASSELPFGGIGASGNLRPSAYYAADYCAYPMASMEGETTVLPANLSPGIVLD